jgi:predicted transcriptional regulator
VSAITAATAILGVRTIVRFYFTHDATRGRRRNRRARLVPACDRTPRPALVRRELDRVAKEDGLSRSDVLRQSLEDFLFVRRFRQLRQRMMAAAQAAGIYTDEDVFTRVS